LEEMKVQMWVKACFESCSHGKKNDTMPGGSLEQRECFQNPGRARVLAEVPWQEWGPQR